MCNFGTAPKPCVPSLLARTHNMRSACSATPPVYDSDATASDVVGGAATRKVTDDSGTTTEPATAATDDLNPQTQYRLKLKSLRKKAPATPSAGLCGTASLLGASSAPVASLNDSLTGSSVASRREQRQPPSRRKARARWIVMMALPFVALALYRHEEIDLATGGKYSVEWLTAATVIILAALGINEYRDGSHVFPATAVVVGSLLWGSLHAVFRDLKLLNFLAFVFFGICAGNLRFHWAVRKLSTRVRHGWADVAWNVILRRLGLVSLFVAGELVGCAIFSPNGVTTVGATGFGFVLLLVLPFATVTISKAASSLLVYLVRDRHDANSRDVPAWRTSLVYWGSTIVFSVATLFFVVGYFLFSFTPLLWSLQELLSPYGALFELITFQSRRQNRTTTATDAANVPAGQKAALPAAGSDHESLLQRIRADRSYSGIH